MKCLTASDCAVAVGAGTLQSQEYILGRDQDLSAAGVWTADEV